MCWTMKSVKVSVITSHEKQFIIGITRETFSRLKSIIGITFEVYEFDYDQGEYFEGIPYTIENLEKIRAEFRVKFAAVNDMEYC